MNSQTSQDGHIDPNQLSQITQSIIEQLQNFISTADQSQPQKVQQILQSNQLMQNLQQLQNLALLSSSQNDKSQDQMGIQNQINNIQSEINTNFTGTQNNDDFIKFRQLQTQHAQNNVTPQFDFSQQKKTNGNNPSLNLQSSDQKMNVKRAGSDPATQQNNPMLVSIPISQNSQSKTHTQVMDSQSKINELRQLVQEAENINQQIVNNDSQIEQLHQQYNNLSQEEQNQYRQQMEERLIYLQNDTLAQRVAQNSLQERYKHMERLVQQQEQELLERKLQGFQQLQQQNNEFQGIAGQQGEDAYPQHLSDGNNNKMGNFNQNQNQMFPVNSISNVHEGQKSSLEIMQSELVKQDNLNTNIHLNNQNQNAAFNQMTDGYKNFEVPSQARRGSHGPPDDNNFQQQKVVFGMSGAPRVLRVNQTNGEQGRIMNLNNSNQGQLSGQIGSDRGSGKQNYNMNLIHSNNSQVNNSQLFNNQRDLSNLSFNSQGVNENINQQATKEQILAQIRQRNASNAPNPQNSLLFQLNLPRTGSFGMQNNNAMSAGNASNRFDNNSFMSHGSVHSQLSYQNNRQNSNYRSDSANGMINIQNQNQNIYQKPGQLSNFELQQQQTQAFMQQQTQKQMQTSMNPQDQQAIIQQLQMQINNQQMVGGPNNNNSGTKVSFNTGTENVIRFRDHEYQFYGKGIISDEQAMEIFEKLLIEQKDPTQSQRTLTQWKDDETHLFQYSLFAFLVKNDKFVEELTDQDWEKISEIVPTKDATKCKKRWLFIQKLGGNKTKWTKKEDESLTQLIVSNGAKDWSSIAEKLYESILEFMKTIPQKEKNKFQFTQRNGKQCRERWLTALDPSINKSQWSLKEDLDFLQKWLTVGNKWREIANMVDGRTESQVKNRFKLILRREMIQQKNFDPEELKNKVIPTIIAQLKERFNKGEDDEMKGGDGAIQNQEGDDSDDDEIDDANKIDNQDMN